MPSASSNVPIISSSTSAYAHERRLEGKVAIITGGAMGIGEVTAKLFCHHGARVVIADIQDDLARSVCMSISPDQDENIVTFIHCDVSKESDVQKAVDFTVSKHGKLDIIFNNAAIIEKPNSRITDFSVADFERVMSVNCTGVFLGTKHAARAMMAKGTKGSIINNGSVCTVVGGMAPHAYVAAKHAVVGLTKNAAAELGQYGIRVNCVSPFLSASPSAKGYFAEGERLEAWVSEIGNLKGGAVLRGEDTAMAAVFLASDESQYISGHNLIVDGGYTAVNNTFGLFKQDV